MARSMRSPPMRIDWAATVSARLMTATSVVPPPMSQTMLASGSATGRPDADGGRLGLGDAATPAGPRRGGRC